MFSPKGFSPVDVEGFSPTLRASLLQTIVWVWFATTARWGKKEREEGRTWFVVAAPITSDGRVERNDGRCSRLPHTVPRPNRQINWGAGGEGTGTEVKKESRDFKQVFEKEIASTLQEKGTKGRREKKRYLGSSSPSSPLPLIPFPLLLSPFPFSFRANAFFFLVFSDRTPC